MYIYICIYIYMYIFILFIYLYICPITTYIGMYNKGVQVKHL